ncbi:MAG: thioesterase family protein [Sedimentisphaerales bacterium]|jgi:acyl-CoA thioester hydrolase|nr:thioesterase family protein [Sedimentisphaerales bacterium]
MGTFPDRTTVRSHSIQIVPRYAETDQAGVVHHSVYPIWFEMGRTELLRANGMAYKDLEGSGFLFVVVELHIRYRRPARYDQPLVLRTEYARVTASRVEHNYLLTDQMTGEVIAEGSSTLACVDRQGRLQRVPSFMYLEDKA